MGTYRHCGVGALVVIEETKGKKCDEQRNASKGRDGRSVGDGCRNREKTNLKLAGDLGSHPLLYIHFPTSTTVLTQHQNFPSYSLHPPSICCCCYGSLCLDSIFKLWIDRTMSIEACILQKVGDRSAMMKTSSLVIIYNIPPFVLTNARHRRQTEDPLKSFRSPR